MVEILGKIIISRSKTFPPNSKGTSKVNTHAIYRCPNYQTSGEKIARLSELNCCTRCGFSKHVSKDCTFTFHNKCRHCSGKHHSWLCNTNTSAKGLVESVNKSAHSVNDDSDSENESSSENESETESIEEVSVSMCSTTVKKSCLPSNAILPTCQGKVNNILCRSLKDSGCQKNFIASSLVKAAGLTPGQQIELTISGFNSAKTYKTYEVNVPFEFGGKVFDLEMIILPSISTKFSADGISSLASSLESKGYLLADTALKNDRNLVEDLDMVLGISATQVFMEKVIPYGENDENYFLETIGGIMPIGHSLNSYSSLKYLPHADKNPKVSKLVKLSTYQNTVNQNSDNLKLLEAKNEKIVKPIAAPTATKKSQNTTSQETKNHENEKSKNTKGLAKSQNSEKTVKREKTKKLKNARSRSRSHVRSRGRNQGSVVKNKPEHKSKERTIKEKEKKNLKKNKNKITGNVAIATPATIEVRSCSSVEDNSETKVNNSVKKKVTIKDHAENSQEILNVGSNFLRSLTPGYSKQQVFGDWCCFGAASEIDLDQLIEQTLGYDQYEKTQQFTDLDSKVMDYVYNKT